MTTYQPQDVTVTIDATTIPEAGFVALDQREKGQHTLASEMTIKAGTQTPCVLNPALLRTREDKLYLNVTEGSVHLYILKEPVSTFSELTEKTCYARFNLTATRYELSFEAGIYRCRVMSALHSAELPKAG